MDNTNLRGPSDRRLIALGQEHEVRYWTNALGVTAEELYRAVKAVGPSVVAVREYIRNNTV